MELYDTPSFCEVGDGVLATNVLMLDEFHTTRSAVEFYPHEPIPIIGARRFDGTVVAMAPLVPWIFVLRKWQLAPEQIVDAWRREQ